MKGIQRVKLWVSLSGDYCAFHETDMDVEFDITNNIQLGNTTVEEMENNEGDYTDYSICSGILYEGEYFISSRL